MLDKYFKVTPFWDRVINSDRDGLPLLMIRNIVKIAGRRIQLHKIVWPDPRERFHSHPALWSIRIILWGGYVEEMHDGTHRNWWPGRIGIVWATDVHRINRLLKERPSYSLWIRGKVRFPTQLVGSGWPAELENTYHRSSENDD